VTHEAVKEWFAYFLIGICTGLVAFIMKIMEEELLEIAKELIHEKSIMYD
jgi:spore maturation protein SpmA